MAFFSSPAGLAWLHRLVLASILVFGKVGLCGTPMVSAFLKLSGHGRFVAASVGVSPGPRLIVCVATARVTR